jgi:hypothetical protein
MSIGRRGKSRRSAFKMAPEHFQAKWSPVCRLKTLYFQGRVALSQNRDSLLRAARCSFLSPAYALELTVPHKTVAEPH